MGDKHLQLVMVNLKANQPQIQQRIASLSLTRTGHQIDIEKIEVSFVFLEHEQTFEFIVHVHVCFRFLLSKYIQRDNNVSEFIQELLPITNAENCKMPQSTKYAD